MRTTAAAATTTTDPSAPSPAPPRPPGPPPQRQLASTRRGDLRPLPRPLAEPVRTAASPLRCGGRGADGGRGRTRGGPPPMGGGEIYMRVQTWR